MAPPDSVPAVLLAADCCLLGRLMRCRERAHTHLEQVDQEVRVLLQVEGDRAVVDLHIGHLHGHVLELHVLPGDRAVCHHHQRGIVVLLHTMDMRVRQLLSPEAFRPV